MRPAWAAVGGRCWASFHQILEHSLQIVVRRGHFPNLAERSGGGERGQPRVELVRLRRLDHHGPLLEPQAEHVISGEEFAGEEPRLRCTYVHRMRMLVNQIPNLMD